MFVLVKYQDGVNKIVPSSDIKRFDPKDISYSKKYKVKWENEEYYNGVIIIVGDTEADVEQKASQKRLKTKPFELYESADDTDSSITGKVEDNKNNNNPKDFIKQIVARKIEKVQVNLDKFVDNRKTGDVKQKKTNSGSLSSVSSIKNCDSKKTAKVACTDVKICARSATSTKNNPEIVAQNQKPINTKNTQQSNIQTSSNKNGKSSDQKKTASSKTGSAIEQKLPLSMLKSRDSKKPPISVNMTNRGCEACKKMEKNCQDEVSSFKHLNNQLKQALKDKDKMLLEATRLNMDLQSKLLDQFDELKLIVGDMKQRAQENLEKNQGVLPVGYRCLDKSMIHLGQDVWITIPQYDSISCLSDTSAKFVKNLAIAVFGTTTLKESSVTGVVSNRVENKDVNAIARPKLDATKLLAIKGALSFWLRTEKNIDEVSIDIEVTRVGSHISHKIFELLRKDKKNNDYLHADGLPEVEIAGNDDDVRGPESDHNDDRNNVSRGSEKSNNEENLDAEQKRDDNTGPELNEEMSAQESDNETEGIIREDAEEPKNRDEDNSDEDDTDSQNTEE